ncbi:DUF6777 domain-containing protein [Streptomyces sp.]|uniref:DUF6777 domain-containing protein n=1 Tax=Streptomyces sp. TaxID=1931 RepID=UPI002D77A165|nr:DUF6777 domain-containing protein [Streptomyces sp.]HET6359948.1 DUF6777 domain-containing protein [Streptomyces sp.]
MLSLFLGVTAMACAAKQVAKVAAESVAYASLDAFFTGGLGFGKSIAPTLSKGGVYKGDKAGLYGGTLRKSSCDVRKLISFLKKPENREKAKAWAEVLDIDDVNKIEAYLKKLTPVLLGNDTLVRNHGFKKGNANAYDAVLEAGTAVLIDVLGLPVVKCNCGNPLASTGTGLGDIELDFKGKKWKYEKKRAVKVDKSPQKQTVVVIVDVDEAGKDIERPPGVDGVEDDEQVTSGRPVAVPDLRGWSEADARTELERLGLKVKTEPDPGSDAEQGSVVGLDPEPDTDVEVGSVVTLKVAGEGTGTPQPGTVPDVRDLTEAEATERLAQFGLTAVVQYQDAADATHEGVVGQAPEPGAELPEDGSVTIKVRRPASPEPSPTDGGSTVVETPGPGDAFIGGGDGGQ